MEVKLKPCPACGGGANHFEMCGGFEACSDGCGLCGPDNDPDGAKWNDLPRRGDVVANKEKIELDFPWGDGKQKVTREQIAAEILALKEGAVMLDAIGSGDLTDTLNAEDAVRARMKWLIAQPVPEVKA